MPRKTLRAGIPRSASCRTGTDVCGTPAEAVVERALRSTGPGNEGFFASCAITGRPAAVIVSMAAITFARITLRVSSVREHEC